MRQRMELPLAEWLDTVLQVANEGESNPVAVFLRGRLKQLLKGTLPLRGPFSRPLPPLFVAVSGRRLQLSAHLGPLSAADAEEIEQEGYIEWISARYRNELEGVVYALSADPLGARVRRCDHCEEFFLAKRNHRRKHHFCRPEHRRAFDHAHRDPETQAAYMRTYRQVRAARARTRKNRA